MAADTPAVRFGEVTHLCVYLPVTGILKEPKFAVSILKDWIPKGIPEKCTENGNKDFTIDLTSKKKVITPSLFSHWTLNGIFKILWFTYRIP